MGFGLLDDPPLLRFVSALRWIGPYCIFMLYMSEYSDNMHNVRKKHYLCADIHLNKYRRIHTNNQIINFYEKHYKETICIGCIGCSCCN